MCNSQHARLFIATCFIVMKKAMLTEVVGERDGGKSLPSEHTQQFFNHSGKRETS